MITKFALNSNIGGVVASKESCQGIQWDVDLLQKWEEKWQIEFSSCKYEVLLFGRINVKINILFMARLLTALKSRGILRTTSIAP